jgi:hypothetical protein
MLRASIQCPIQSPDSLAIVLDAVKALGNQFVLGHAAFNNPFGFQLSPKDGRYFIAEILVPLGGHKEIMRALDILIALNMIYLRAHPREVGLYESGTRYADPGKLAWYTVPLMYDRKEGDCKDLCGVRVAQLRLTGEKASAHLKRVNNRLWHVQVKRGNGTIEDPSRLLGM